MTRELKFRIWSPKYKEFWYKEFGDTFNLKETDIVMQFTGLKDRLGKEIYEGDIVKYFDWCYCSKNAQGPGDGIISKKFTNAFGDSYINYWKPLIGIVKWNEEALTYEPLVDAEENFNSNSFAFVCRGKETTNQYPSSFYEVIGNTHETPNLSPQEKT